MEFKKITQLILLIFILFFTQINTLVAQDDNDNKSVKIVSKAIQKNVESDITDKISAQRKSIIDDAVIAFNETQRALSDLEQNKKHEAIRALGRSSGKLDAVLRKDPNLTLAPISVYVTVHDLYVTPQMVRNIISQIKNKMSSGDLQGARLLMNGLGSEVVTHITHIPLATYPDVIKSIIPLIDANKIEEAKAQLELALNTLVIARRVIPLPFVRSQEMIKRIDELYEEDKRRGSDVHKKVINSLLKTVRVQIELAETLSYGKKSEIRLLYEQLNTIEKTIDKNNSIKDEINKMQQYLSDVLSSYA